jgi:Uma2 family endonuclease
MASDATGLLTRNPWVSRRPLTVAEYHRMGEVGILQPHDRVELIEGELVAMSPIGSEHSGTVNALTRRLVLAVGDRGIVAVRNPVQLDDLSEPEPDFAVLKPRDDGYRRVTPRASDVLLIIEVADSSLSYDRAIKRALYARHGIPEFWIVNLAGQEVEVCRAPGGDDYASVSRVGHGAVLEPTLLPGVVIPVSGIMG